MKHAARILAAALVIIAAALAQRTDTISYQLAANIAASPYTSAAIRNNGQTNHQLTVIFADANGNTCNEGDWNNGSDWYLNGIEILGQNPGMPGPVGITTQIRRVNTGASTATQRGSFMVWGKGAFSQLYARLRFTPTNCAASIWYAGTLFPIPELPGLTWYTNRTLSGYQSGAGTATCNGSAQLLLQDGSFDRRGQQFYGFILTTATATVVTLSRFQQPFGPVYTPDYVFDVPANVPFILPFSEYPYFDVPPETDFALTCAGAGHALNAVWWYRQK